MRKEKKRIIIMALLFSMFICVLFTIIPVNVSADKKEEENMDKNNKLYNQYYKDDDLSEELDKGFQILKAVGKSDTAVFNGKNTDLNYYGRAWGYFTPKRSGNYIFLVSQVTGVDLNLIDNNNVIMSTYNWNGENSEFSYTKPVWLEENKRYKFIFAYKKTTTNSTPILNIMFNGSFITGFGDLFCTGDESNYNNFIQGVFEAPYELNVIQQGEKLSFNWPKAEGVSGYKLVLSTDNIIDDNDVIFRFNPEINNHEFNIKSKYMNNEIIYAFLYHEIDEDVSDSYRIDWQILTKPTGFKYFEGTNNIIFEFDAMDGKAYLLKYKENSVYKEHICRTGKWEVSKEGLDISSAEVYMISNIDNEPDFLRGHSVPATNPTKTEYPEMTTISGNKNGTQFIINWDTPVIDGCVVDHYEIYSGEDEENMIKLQDVNENSYTYNIINDEPLKFKVIAKFTEDSKYAETQFSNIVEIEVSSLAITNLNLDFVEMVFKLEWDELPNAQEYEIWFGYNEDDITKINSTSTTSYIRDLVADDLNQTVYFKVRVKMNGDEENNYSKFSNVVSVEVEDNASVGIIDQTVKDTEMNEKEYDPISGNFKAYYSEEMNVNYTAQFLPGAKVYDLMFEVLLEDNDFFEYTNPKLKLLLDGDEVKFNYIYEKTGNKYILRISPVKKDSYEGNYQIGISSEVILKDGVEVKDIANVEHEWQLPYNVENANPDSRTLKSSARAWWNTTEGSQTGDTRKNSSAFKKINIELKNIAELEDYF